MKPKPAVTCVFVDVGGVLLTNGWDHLARKRAAKHFHMDWAGMDERHRLNFETHEEDKITFEEYLNRVVFYKKRPFTREQFQRFAFEQSKPYADTIRLISGLKQRYGLRVAVVSNESRAINAYRIRQFHLDSFVDTFISSCFVHLRKPDVEIFRLALDVAQAPAEQVVYIENTPMFVEIAEGLGIRSILHKNCEATRQALASMGLRNEEVMHAGQ